MNDHATLEYVQQNTLVPHSRARTYLLKTPASTAMFLTEVLAAAAVVIALLRLSLGVFTLYKDRPRQQ